MKYGINANEESRGPYEKKKKRKKKISQTTHGIKVQMNNKIS